MAITAGIPGLQVTINVNGEALAEYDHDADHAANHDPAPHSVVKYIQARAGEEFEIGTLYKEPFSPPSQLHADIMMDGGYVPAPFMEWGGEKECEGYRYRKATFMDKGTVVTRNFQFAALETEEDNRRVTAEQKRQVSDIGQIIVYMYYVEGLEEASSVNIPQADSEGDRPISCKAMKAALTPGDAISYQTGLSDPEQQENITLKQVRTASNEPFATFNFYYRSEAALKSLGIIARTPSPSPPPSASPKPERSLDEMSEEEMRAELRQLREQQQQQAMSIKRERDEREDSAVTLRGDDDEEDVKFVGERTAERLAKRARQMPREGDVVWELDSD